MDLYWIYLRTKRSHLLCCFSLGFRKWVAEFSSKEHRLWHQIAWVWWIWILSLLLIRFFSFRVNALAFQFDVTSLHYVDNEDHSSIYLIGRGSERNTLNILILWCLFLLNPKVFGQLSLSVKSNESQLSELIQIFWSWFNFSVFCYFDIICPRVSTTAIVKPFQLVQTRICFLFSPTVASPTQLLTLPAELLISLAIDHILVLCVELLSLMPLRILSSKQKRFVAFY